MKEGDRGKRSTHPHRPGRRRPGDRGFRRDALAALILAFLAAGAAAAREVPADLTEVPLEQLLAIDVVYGASRFEQKVTEAPSSVTVVTAEDIRLYGYETLAELLAGVRGFYTTYDRNYTYLGVRGFSRPSDYNARVLLMIDGHRINENIFGSSYFGPEQILDLDLVERVEIIRGPGSSLYGTNAFFAVVNVLTRKAEALRGVRLSALGGSYGAVAGRGSWARALESGGEFLLAGSTGRSDGQDLFFEEFGAEARDADAEDFARAFARLRLGNLTFQALYNRREKVVPTGSYGTVFGSPDNDTVDARATFDLRYERRMGSRVDVLARLTYDNYYYRGHYDYGDPYTEWYDSTWLGGEIQASFKPSDRHRLTLGGEYRDHPRQALRFEDLSVPASGSTRVEARDYALFVQDEFRPSRNLTLNLGLRYDRYSSFGGSANPRLALLFHPSEKRILKLIYGEAFRAPNAAELFLAAAANPDLQPESIREESVVYEQYVGRGFLFVGNLFRYRIRRLIGIGGGPSFENLRPIHSLGAEVEIEKRWPRGIRLQASWAYQDTEDADDGQLSNSPGHVAKVHAGFPFLDGRLRLGAEALYLSDRQLLAGGETEGHLLANLTLTVPALAPGLDLSAGVLNLFDAEYLDPAANFHAPLRAIPQNGRNARLRLTWRF